MATEVDALQTTLAAEHAAVYVYGLLGSRTSEAVEPELYAALHAAYEAHRDRGLLVGEIAAQSHPDTRRAGLHPAAAGCTRPTAATRRP